MQISSALRSTALLATLSLLAVSAGAERARADGRLEASYSISVARIPIGSVTANIEFAGGQYSVSMNGRAGGLLRVFSSGEGTLTTSGVLKDGRPSPQDYVASTTSDGDKLDVKMTLDGGSVTQLAASQPEPSADRLAITEAHQKAITDPLSAVLVPASADGAAAGKEACERTLPIFDGRRRYDLKLAFKRMEQVKADKGYAGPVAVCAVAFQPVAGHRPSSSLIKYLGEGREIEIAFAPVAGTGMLAPFRVSIANLLGNLVVQAIRFETLAPSSTRAATTGQGR